MEAAKIVVTFANFMPANLFTICHRVFPCFEKNVGMGELNAKGGTPRSTFVARQRPLGIA